jgi:hypothetical protein
MDFENMDNMAISRKGVNNKEGFGVQEMKIIDVRRQLSSIPCVGPFLYKNEN